MISNMLGMPELIQKYGNKFHASAATHIPFRLNGCQILSIVLLQQ